MTVRPEIDCCWKCGYDLRGARGDFLRCSECGEANNRRAAGPDGEAWRRKRWSRWAAMTLLGLSGALAGLLGSCFTLGLTRGDWALPLVCAVTWGLSGLAVVAVRHMVTPERLRHRRRRRTLVVAALVGGACAATVLGIFFIAIVLLADLPSPH